MRLLIFISLVCLCFTVDPPVWALRWTQDFVENYTSAGGVYTVGRHWYDYNNSNERVTYQNGEYEAVCSSIMPNVNTACTQVITNGNLWVIFPEKQQCCRCCDGASGCLIKNPNWLKPFSYVGQESLSGETFYKWTYKNVVDYYAKESDMRIPRRIVTTGYKTEDFIMNSYSEDVIPKQIFELPSYCSKDCSRATICGQLQPGKSLKQQ